MLENIPSQSAMTELLGQSLFEVWQGLCAAIDEKYEMERLWNTGGKNWTYYGSLCLQNKKKPVQIYYSNSASFRCNWMKQYCHNLDLRGCWQYNKSAGVLQI